MKIAAIADIHGNLFALESVLADCKTKGIDRYIFLGDYITDGPFSNEVLEIIQNLDGIAVKGNRENRTLRLNPEHYSKAMAAAYWTLDRLKDESIQYITSLQDEIQVNISGIDFHISHHPAFYFKHTNGIFDVADVQEILNNTVADIEIYGHTHRPMLREQGGKIVFNPGSCGLSLNGDNRAMYGIISIENDTIQCEHCYCDYDIDSYLQSFFTSGLVNDCPAWTKCTIRSISTGNNYFVEFLMFAKSLMREHNRPMDRFIGNDIWDLALALYDFDQPLTPVILCDDITGS